MRILFKGTDPQEELWGGTCYNCKTVIEAQRKELKIESNQRDGSWAIASCPVCGKQIHLYKKERNNR